MGLACMILVIGLSAHSTECAGHPAYTLRQLVSDSDYIVLRHTEYTGLIKGAKTARMSTEKTEDSECVRAPSDLAVPFEPVEDPQSVDRTGSLYKGLVPVDCALGSVNAQVGAEPTTTEWPFKSFAEAFKDRDRDKSGQLSITAVLYLMDRLSLDWPVRKGLRGGRDVRGYVSQDTEFCVLVGAGYSEWGQSGPANYCMVDSNGTLFWQMEKDVAARPRVSADGITAVISRSGESGSRLRPGPLRLDFIDRSGQITMTRIWTNRVMMPFQRYFFHGLAAFSPDGKHFIISMNLSDDDARVEREYEFVNTSLYLFDSDGSERWSYAAGQFIPERAEFDRHRHIYVYGKWGHPGAVYEARRSGFYKFHISGRLLEEEVTETTGSWGPRPSKEYGSVAEALQDVVQPGSPSLSHTALSYVLSAFKLDWPVDYSAEGGPKVVRGYVSDDRQFCVLVSGRERHHWPSGETKCCLVDSSRTLHWVRSFDIHTWPRVSSRGITAIIRGTRRFPSQSDFPLEGVDFVDTLGQIVGSWDYAERSGPPGTEGYFETCAEFGPDGETFIMGIASYEEEYFDEHSGRVHTRSFVLALDPEGQELWNSDLGYFQISGLAFDRASNHVVVRGRWEGPAVVGPYGKPCYAFDMAGNPVEAPDQSNRNTLRQEHPHRFRFDITD
jgi:hypothetical protein